MHNFLNLQEIEGYEYVMAEGEYNNAKLLVCKRPEFRDTDEMVREIKDVYDESFEERRG